MAYYGYTRVSTGRQVEAGVSLYAQKQYVQGMAMMQGGEIKDEDIFSDDAISGAVHLAERPQGSKLLERARKGDVIFAYRLDRMFRSSLDALMTVESLQKKGIGIVFGDLGDLQSTPGKLMLTILAAVAESERAVTRERIIDVKRSQAKKQRYLGGRLPFGHEVDAEGKIRLTERGQALRAHMKLLRDQGKSLRHIVLVMKSQGVSISHTGVRDAVAAETKACSNAMAR